ncbi:MAG: hypothetical protein ACLQUY_03895 [Ktedonobacterales bacterium]
MDESVSAAVGSAAEGTSVRRGSLRCQICDRRLGKSLFFVEETGDVPPPRMSWVLCRACNDAVHQQMELSPVQSPVRLRVAVGLVAASRTPASRRARLGQFSDESWLKIFLWLVPIALLVHFAVLVAIAALFR